VLLGGEAPQAASNANDAAAQLPEPKAAASDTLR
jgi:hypothetical protein